MTRKIGGDAMDDGEIMDMMQGDIEERNELLRRTHDLLNRLTTGERAAFYSSAIELDTHQVMDGEQIEAEMVALRDEIKEAIG